MAERNDEYYPLPESRGGWRVPADPGEAREVARIDPEQLQAARAWNADLGIISSVAVVRRGYLVAEWYEFGTDPDTRFNIYSCSKSFTGTSYGILFDDVRQGKLAGSQAVDLDSLAYDFVPEGHPLTDPRKAQITLRHLLSMSSGIPGEAAGIRGIPVAEGMNHFEGALGRAPLFPKTAPGELWASELAGDPGTVWDYSDPAFVHLSLAFPHITGQEMAPFLQERAISPIGIENMTWEPLGIDDGRIGQHTNASSGVIISARELARFGYLMLQGGVWDGRQLVPRWWLEMATRASQPHQLGYGLTWWTNSEGALWDGVPRDAFAAMGFNTNLCCVIPSLELVIVRIGAGPTESTEVVTGPFLAAAVNSVVR